MNSLTTSKRREIIHFFEDLTHRMKNNLLSQEEEQRMTECYLSYLYSSSNHSNHSEKENLKKYIVMGWYVYHNVNSVNNVNSNDSDSGDNNS